MRQVAAIAVVGLVAVTATITSVQIVRVRAEMLDQSRAQNEEFRRRFDRLERIVAVVGSRSAALPAVLPGSSPAPRNGTNPEAAKSEVLAENLPDRAERIQAGNAIVDHAIQDGHWSVSDLASFGAATNGLTGEERSAMMAKLAAAVNANQVKLDVRLLHP